VNSDIAIWRVGVWRRIRGIASFSDHWASPVTPFDHVCSTCPDDTMETGGSRDVRNSIQHEPHQCQSVQESQPVCESQAIWPAQSNGNESNAEQDYHAAKNGKIERIPNAPWTA
jgi:hypothetical protein